MSNTAARPDAHVLASSLPYEVQRKLAPRRWKEIAELPSVVNAKFVRHADAPSLNHISVFTHQRDVDQDKVRKFVTPHFPIGATPPLANDDGSPAPSYRAAAFPAEYAAVSGLFPSPSGTKLAIVREVGDKAAKGDKTNSSIEIVDHVRLVSCTTSPKLHGKIYSGGQLGGVAWSPDENEIAFVAERVAPKTTSYFESLSDEDKKDDEKSKEEKDDKNPEPKPSEGDDHLYRRDWGAGFVGMFDPSLFVFNVETKKSRAVKGVPKDLSVGQITWTPDGAGLVFVGYSTTPRRFGVRAYNTRPSKLYHVPVPPAAEGEKKDDADAETSDSPKKEDEEDLTHLLTPDDHSACEPRFSPNGKVLAYFTTDAVQVHFSSQRLRRIRWDFNEKVERLTATTVVDIVENPTPDEFPGITIYFGVARQCWSPDSQYMFFESLWRSRLVMLRVNMTNGDVTPMFKTPELGGGTGQAGFAEILDIADNQILCRMSNPVYPHSTWTLPMEAFDTPDDTSLWTRVTQPYVPETLNGLSWEIVQVEPTGKGDLKSNFESVLVMPRKIEGGAAAAAASAVENTDGQGAAATSPALPPLIVEPHGGPHGCYASWWSYGGMAYLYSLGYAFLFVNFRGSLGFGEKMVKSVLGTGQDTDDCVSATNVIKARGIVDENRLGIIGCSHGGYLTCMLAGRHPSLFKVAVPHNPVCDIAANSAVTDIPDWCYVESGLPYGTPQAPKNIPTADDYVKMFNNSPIAHVGDVTTPMLMLLGGKDLRVPLGPNMNYMNILASRGDVATRTMLYEKGTHGLADTVAMDGDVHVNRALWLAKYLSPDAAAESDNDASNKDKKEKTS